MIEKRRIRDSRYELGRIIAIILISLNHVPFSSEALPANYYLGYLFKLGGKLGVNFFVITGAWFLTQKTCKDIAINKIKSIVLQSLFWGFFLNLISSLVLNSFVVHDIFKGLTYWYTWAYAIMLLISPFLDNISDKLKYMIILLFTPFCTFLVFLGYYSQANTVAKVLSNDALVGPIWFIYVYMLVGLLRKKWEQINAIGIKGWCGIFIISYLLMYYVEIRISGPYIRNMYSPICLICAVGLFGIISNLRIKPSQKINSIAHKSYGMYLTQTHKIFRNILWERFLNAKVLSTASLLWALYAVIMVLVIYIITVLVQKMYDLLPIESVKK